MGLGNAQTSQTDRRPSRPQRGLHSIGTRGCPGQGSADQDPPRRDLLPGRRHLHRVQRRLPLHQPLGLRLELPDRLRPQQGLQEDRERDGQGHQSWRRDHRKLCELPDFEGEVGQRPHDQICAREKGFGGLHRKEVLPV